MAKLRITYSKSAIGYTVRQKATIKALGFTRLYQTVEHEDSPAIRGMIHAVNHLLTVEEVASDKAATAKVTTGEVE
jgi:large subunit ribosomal protein L30